MDQTHHGYDPRVHRGHRDHHVRPFSLHDYRDRGRHGHLFSYGRDHHDHLLYDHPLFLHDHRGRGHHDRLFSYGHDHRDLRDHQKYFSL